MSNDNFFVKFAHFYKHNIFSVGWRFSELWESVCFIADDVKDIFINLFIGIVRIIQIFIPISTIYNTIISKYLTEHEVEKLVGKKYNCKSGYFARKEIKEYQERINKELKETTDD